MKNLYYTIWADAIVHEKTHFKDKRNWKFFTLIPISVFQGINLATFFLGLFALNVKMDIFIHFNFFNGNDLDAFLSSFVSLLLPFLILNWFLIFKDKKYIKIVERYSRNNNNENDKNGKYYLAYMLISAAIFIIPIILFL